MASLPSNVALANIADGTNIIASDHRNNYSALQAVVNALITLLAAGSSGQTFQSGGGTTVQWASATLLTATGSGAQTIANGGQANVVNWTPVTQSGVTMSGGVATVGSTGVYIVTVYGFWAVGVNSREVIVTASSARSGPTSLAQFAPAPSGQATHQTLTGILDLNSGSTLTVAAFQDSGGNLAFTPQGFNVARVGV